MRHGVGIFKLRHVAVSTEKITPTLDPNGASKANHYDESILRGFGVFIVKPRKRGIGRNPRTGEEVAIPSGKTIRFKPGKELQAREEAESPSV